ncbi:MAG: RNA-directed DNA polymerase [Deltaproteobacteria bacterium]|nr:MAG: RNA-directed DNA polymerase [Deltaproteobacteria bacterium]
MVRRPGGLELAENQLEVTEPARGVRHLQGGRGTGRCSFLSTSTRFAVGLFDWFRKRKDEGLDTGELARRLGVSESDLDCSPRYNVRTIPKRNGGRRRIAEPSRELKQLQRVILRRLLSRLKAHPAAHGFEKGRSAVTHSANHCGKKLIVVLDIEDFFRNTTERRVRDYFRSIGWNEKASELLTRLTTFEGGLPQGAPTSPRLSNLVNYTMDLRLSRFCDMRSITYSRYADDLCFSTDDESWTGQLLRTVPEILSDFGYRVNRAKTRFLRAHQRQLVTGLVVNEKVNLPRSTRRWLRAVEHRMLLGGTPTISEQQFRGWLAYRQMVERR